MEMTKYGHSCVRLEKDGAALVIDPGGFSDAATALRDADALLITHEHQDHIDNDAVRAAAAANRELRIWAPETVATSLADLGERVSVAAGDTQFQAAGFDVQTFGGQHALIHPLIPVVANVCYLVEGSVYHPGDSFIVPTQPVTTLLAPIHAPWSKVAEVIDFVTAVRAPTVHQIHDGLLNPAGLGLVESLVTGLGARTGSQYRHLDDDARFTVA
ncbi:MAG: MBL fold metallo-hydrolase [bacterium]